MDKREELECEEGTCGTLDKCAGCSKNPQGGAESLQVPTNAMNHIRKVIAVVSGKGGVGKSMVTGLMAAGMTSVVLYVGLAMVVLGPVLTNKGFGKITGIFGSLYNHITGYFGDILSYSRLMALMLAGSVIAQVFNTLGAIPGNIIVFLIISLAGNALNFALNLLGCYVHDLRLQCLEYFGKFYEDGGKPFKPLMADTKYVDITK